MRPTVSPLPRKGMSLIELLTVIVIIGVMAMFALPRMRIDRYSVDGAVRTISMALMVAQREAVSRGHNVIVVFDTSSNVIRTVWDGNNNFIIDAGEKTRPFLIPERVVFGRGSGVPALNGAGAMVPSLREVSGMPAMALQRTGSTDKAFVMYFTTQSARSGMSEHNDTRAMVVERATGRPTWWIYTQGSWKRG